MSDLLTNIPAFIFALGVIIIVHEAGHLLVAKAFNVKVLAFSIGFGRSLWSFRRGETEYRIAVLPLGGYVRMDGEGLEEGINDSLQPTDRAGQPESSADDPRRFGNKPRWQRILIYLAGPVMNVLLALGLFAALFMVGIEVANLPDMPPIIGSVEPGSSSAAAGLQSGDRIVTVNREPAQSWAEVGLALLTSPDKPVALSVQRGGSTFAATVTPKRMPRYESGDFAGLFPIVQPHITKVEANSPAEAAGLRVGDEIRAVDGVPVTDSSIFVDMIHKRPGQKVELRLMRRGEMLTLSVVPRNDHGVGMIGVSPGFYQRYAPGQAVVESVKYSVRIVSETFKVLGKIVRGEMSAKGALAGPLEIARESGAAARAGFKNLLHLMGFISVSIALLNLMPIPILDGGQIFILLVEEVIRRDLSPRVKEAITQVGFVLILMLMGMVLWFDLGKIDFTKWVPAGWMRGS